jgi:hypothetical protein
VAVVLVFQESGNSSSISSSPFWLSESVHQPVYLLAEFLFSTFTKDTLYVVKTANFIQTGKHARGKPRMRWVEGMYNTWMEGGRLEGSAKGHVCSQRASLTGGSTSER